MGHGHDHHGHGHAHGPDRRADARALAGCSALTAGFAVAEVVGGLVAGSLALLADAAHMVSDVRVAGARPRGDLAGAAGPPRRG